MLSMNRLIMLSELTPNFTSSTQTVGLPLFLPVHVINWLLASVAVDFLPVAVIVCLLHQTERSSILLSIRACFFTTTTKPALWLTQPHIRLLEGIFLRNKAAWALSRPPACSEIKNAWTLILSWYPLLVWCLDTGATSRTVWGLNI
jgi:hypothetical protein